jgi:hypothetical protein
VVFVNDLQVFDSADTELTEAEALERLRALHAADPALRGRLQVVPAFELTAVE